MGSLDLSVLRGHQLPSVTSDPIAEQEECPGTGLGFMALHRLGWAVNLRGGGKRTVSNCNISLWALILFWFYHRERLGKKGILTRNPK